LESISSRCFQVSVDDATIGMWLNQQPFSGKAPWRKGPVSELVLCGQGGVPDDVHYAIVENEKSHRFKLIVLDAKNHYRWFNLF
jgi:hypothetical protein